MDRDLEVRPLPPQDQEAGVMTARQSRKEGFPVVRHLQAAHDGPSGARPGVEALPHPYVRAVARQDDPVQGRSIERPAPEQGRGARGRQVIAPSRDRPLGERQEQGESSSHVAVDDRRIGLV
jgi:hypothetical protein